MRAGVVSDDPLANASVRVWHDANADARIDMNEVQAQLTSSSAATLRGQFAIPDSIAQAVAAAPGVLQFTSTGGAVTVLGQEVAVAGPVQYMAYRVHPFTDSATDFQVVLSPLSTLAAQLFRKTLVQGTPVSFDAQAQHAETLGFIADTLGVPMPAQQLMTVAPEHSAVQRIVAERQMNALLNALVALSTGKQDASDAALSAQASAAIAQGLAGYLVNHGSLDPTDATQLRQLVVSALPDALPIADALAASLAPLMSAFALAADGDDGMSRAAQAVMPQLAQLMAGLHAPMAAGTLALPATQTQLDAQLAQLRSALQSRVSDGTPLAYARVIVNDNGAFIDRNVDGRLDDADQLGGVLVSANYAAGGNAELAARRVVLTWQGLPVAAQLPPLSGLTADDRVALDLDSANYGHHLDLKWSASEANGFLKAAQDKGLKADLSLVAHGLGASAALAIGKLPEVDSTQGVTAQFGALSVLAAGNLNGAMASDASLLVGLGGSTPGLLGGPVRVQAAGAGSRASLAALSNGAITAVDATAVATGAGATAMATLKSAADKSLGAGALMAASHADRSNTILSVDAGAGGGIAGSAAANAAGAGATSTLNVAAVGGGLRIGATSGANFVPGDVSAVASGSLLSPSGEASGHAASARVELLAHGGNLAVGAVTALASGLGSSAGIVARADTGTAALNGPVTVEARATGSSASLEISGHAGGGATGTALQLASLLALASGAGAAASADLSAGGGKLGVGGDLAMQASGDDATATLHIHAGSAPLSVSGNWSQAASGNHARTDVQISRTDSGAAALDLTGTVTLDVTGSNGGASLRLLPDAPSSGDISATKIVLNAAADQTTTADQIALALVTGSGKFTSPAGLEASASGTHATIDAELGARTGSVDIARLQQRAVGAGSQIDTHLMASDALLMQHSVRLEAAGAFAFSRTQLDAGSAFSITAPVTDAPDRIRVESTGYGSGTEAIVNISSGDVTLYGPVSLYRSGATGTLIGAHDLTRLALLGQTRDVELDGALELTADTGAINGRVQAELPSVSGIMHLGSLSISSHAFNSLARLDALVHLEPGGEPAAAQFRVDGNVVLNSTADARTGPGAPTGAASVVIVEGSGAHFLVGGNLLLQSTGDFTASSAHLEALPDASATASRIGGSIAITAAGVGSRADALLVTASTLAVGGTIELMAAGVDAQARLGMSNLADFNGSVLVTALSAPGGNLAGAFADLRLDGLAAMGSQLWTVNAVNNLDRAVLDISLQQYGGVVKLGTVGSRGTGYLQLRAAPVQQVIIEGNQGHEVVALSMPDLDQGHAEAIGTMMTLTGFRPGTDYLRFDVEQVPALSWRGVISVAPGSVDAQLEAFLTEADAQLAGQPGAFVTAFIGPDEFIAFDYDGSGLTGLLKLSNVGNVLPGSSLVTTDPVPQVQNIDLSSVPLADISDPASEEVSSGDIERADVSVSVAHVAERRTVRLNAESGKVLATNLVASADAYRGQAIAELNASQASSVVLMGNLALSANALSSVAQADLAGGHVLIKGSINANATGARSDAALSLAGANFQLESALNLSALGEYATAKASLDNVYQPASGDSIALLASGLNVKSAGFHSSAELKLISPRVEHLLLAGDVVIDAAGDESTATMTAHTLSGTVQMQHQLLVLASGVGASASFRLTDSASLQDPFSFTRSVAGPLTAEARGVRSLATADLQFGSRGGIELGGALSALASGEQGTAAVGLSTLAGNVGLPTVLIDASAVQGQASAQVTVGELVTDQNNVPRSVSGEGDLDVGDLDVRARALGAHADAGLRAFNGQLSILSDIDVAASAADGVATLFMQAGASRQDADTGLEFNAAVGALNIAQDVRVQASAAHSEASVAAQAHNELLKFSGSLKLVAAGTDSTALLDAHALSNFTADGGFATAEDLPPAPLEVVGGLTVVASNVRAQARANLSSSAGHLQVGGSLSALASADRATSAIGLSTRFADILLSGDLMALSSGNASHAVLKVGTETLAPPEVLVNRPGKIDVGGAVTLLATGTNAVSELELVARPHNGVKIGKGIDISADGGGSLARLTLTAANTMTSSAPDDVMVSGLVRLSASSAASTAEAALTAEDGDVAIGGLWLSASGTGSHASFIAGAGDSLALGSGLQTVAGGFDSSATVTLSAASGALTVNGSVALIASGEASLIDASLTSASGSLAISKDVSAMALADGSEVHMTLSQGSGSSVSVAGQIRLASDSGAASVSGATSSATLVLGKLGLASTDLLLTAVQSADRSEASLQLLADGGVVRMGGATQHGTALLTLNGTAAATGNQLVDTIDIDFTGSAGQAVIRFDADQDNLTAAALPVVKLSGFRLETDALHFGSLPGIDLETGFTSLSAFTSSALSHFSPGAPGVFAGGSTGLDKTFIAYDIDGSGVTAIIELDGVGVHDFVNHYQTANGLG